MGKIVKTYEGSDGKVCMVSLKTSNGVIQRTINKLVYLPVTTESKN